MKAHFQPFGFQGIDIFYFNLSGTHTQTHTAQQTHITQVTRIANMGCIQHMSTTGNTCDLHNAYKHSTCNPHCKHSTHVQQCTHTAGAHTHTPPHVFQRLPHPGRRRRLECQLQSCHYIWIAPSAELKRRLFQFISTRHFNRLFSFLSHASVLISPRISI